ncbi:MAG: hypothetical protein JST19_21240, partial [Bacteroidetes bacterium]|nr:hypothetical protein [Bacteroidota bacterium]
MKRFAEILSAIFIPLFAPTYLCIIILLFFHDMTGLRGLPQELIFVLLTFLVTCAPPFLVVYLLFRIGVIKSLSLEHRKDRRIPQAVGCLNYLWITVFLEMRFGSAHIFSVVMLSTTSLVFLI